MDTKQYEELENLQSQLADEHKEQMNRHIKNLNLVISNYHFKKEPNTMMENPIIQDKVDEDVSDIVDYMNHLYETNIKLFKTI